ncbi:MAG: 30S ribosomal protein S4 [Parcubacteria group bacterium GW2011_GWA1_44_13]|uniref:Small ribosomal subunit protein uS4 n=1 Tax=Candidatus Nomurabacteria bacterium GW2011_GWB1_44_12 TaxID=1618748 RepID=A0A837IE96_9BACT|nr:MAG: 30S ribosomal protein S4 [Candidatus Nomurabacteria bacterium GW2011_GWD1_44_10]KKT37232.1 MAG: 30S ribosomal protein S4 [Candidatus Nomurabacteria bacterium GW2011_GWB1_44_12]KKT38543.1 MAG: 30S ribosomal protein S4 [Parcubacteria group bacterium GW2011_GWA1_44_13]KKT60943.1 MAG: ribosomal protein S4, small subunit ribosomal protein S4 [Parcubacteria group bacterium GW2011_GWC1_44_26]HBB44459.1 30S ribosomal protein S4 [Candidatus Yonathbacteria bacterium]
MSRVTCKICRRLGETICGREKCAFKKRPYPPGKVLAEKKHRSTVTDYGRQLREKQKVRHTYGVSETQFSNYVKEASGKHGINPAEYLFEALESRLDNAVFRAGFVASRSLSRQIVSHGHIMVNGRRTNIASRRMKIGDVIAIRPGSMSTKLFETLAERFKTVTVPTWFKLDTDKLTATFQGKPKPGQAEMSFNLTSVIEFYSR